MQKRIRLAGLLAALLLLAALESAAQTIKIATWNIEHLRAEINTGANRRDLEDFARLAGYAQRLNADIIALQEVDGAAAASRIFDSAQYNFFFSNRNNTQRTGFAVRKTLAAQQQPDVTTLDVTGGLRHGTDIAVSVGGKMLRLLSVHLKSGCWQKALPAVEAPLGSSCEKLAAQVAPLEAWIDGRAQAETPFVVLGDFNRRFGIEEGDNKMEPELDDSDPPNADLTRVTEGRTSGCWNGEFPDYIDHIVLDKQATAMLVANSFEQVVYTENASLKKKLSDHCPIAVQLAVSGSGPTPNSDIEAILSRIAAIEAELAELRRQVEALRP